MFVNLKKSAKSREGESVSIEISQRLPAWIEAPCHLTCHYSVQAMDGFYLLTLKLKGELNIICQRCLQLFNTAYENESLLAICDSEEQAEKLLSHYESIVADNNEVDLVDLVTDELHLYSPNYHLDVTACDPDVEQYIKMSNDEIQ